MLTDHERIARQREEPAILRLHRALTRLTGVITYLNTGAHPDDEHNGLLAALRFAHGMRVVVACSTRGEGGQNAIGPERGAALGVLRTREMEEAARVIDAGVVWLGHGPDDPVQDFGFSKSGEDTLARWGEARILERLVRAYRSERPDIVAPTFLDVPGQHGHHRAMTRAAIQAFALAADPDAFPEHRAEGLAPWQAAKLYLPAWSGAGTAYDDEDPPPPETVAVEPPRRDPVTGATYAQIGEWSRALHRSQGMGIWRDAGRTRWPLHLLLHAGRTPGPEGSVLDGLPRTIGELASLGGLPADVGRTLAAAQAAIDAALAAFPDGRRITPALLDAARSIEAARAACPPGWAPRMAHRLARKAREIDAALFEAEGVVARACARPARIAPGEAADIEVFVEASTATAVAFDAVTSGAVHAVGTSDTGGLAVIHLAAHCGAPPSSPYPPSFDPLGGRGEAVVRLRMRLDGREASRLLDLEQPLLVRPAASLRLDPDAVVINLARPRGDVRIEVAVDGAAGPDALSFEAPEGWGVAREPHGIRLVPPPDLQPGRTALRPMLAGQPAYRVMPVPSAPGGADLTQFSELPVLAVEARLPDGARVAYVGGGNDRVGTWLARMGFDVAELDPGRLAQGDLSAFTTIVAGIFAFGTRADLRAAAGRLRAFVEAGGHLVTLYHRPSDGWDPDATPPRRIEIGLPSVRWRVTDPGAPVRVLAPGHPLLTHPNRIAPEDWSGWDKERGLYFAAEWDPAYTPLLALNDPGERPLEGALLTAEIGRGRHTHCALVLHHQLDRLVPGAFRLMANLVQPA
ncbi:MAG TPA: PIG-L family deacetylase [Microvirga sp.]|jgi:LmbE family N-acetylglucosaminyl deacetylase|nr:PIG-L family deacetylase [Microvirga sp.]